MEAWRRQLNDPVSAFPIAKAGPAHIATLKTFDPPLQTLEGRQLRGVERRGKRLLGFTSEFSSAICPARRNRWEQRFPLFERANFSTMNSSC